MSFLAVCFLGMLLLMGSCLWLHHNISVTINQSTFVNNNIGIKGGVILPVLVNLSRLTAKTSATNKTVLIAHKLTSLPKEKYKQSLSIYDSYFVNNTSRVGEELLIYAKDSIDLFVKEMQFY